MLKLGEFIYPWGNGHYTRMMMLNDVLPKFMKDEFEIHFSSKAEIYQKLLKKYPSQHHLIHEILMPTPVDGKIGPSISLSLLNVFFPISQNPPLVKQISDYMIAESKLYDREEFDLVINDGDIGSNVIAQKYGVPSIFVTNQFRTRLWKSRLYFYPSLVYVAKQIAKATKILVADSPPPYTMCEYNLNFPKNVQEKVTYVGHFANHKSEMKMAKTDLIKLIEGEDFGYWMRTGNKSTNDATGRKYEKIFHDDEMKTEKRLVSHARADPSIDMVIGTDGKKYSINDALRKKIDWLQIDVGYLTEAEKQSTLKLCKYAVINGSHTAMGETLGVNSKPIIGIPIYDEHTNHIKWAEERNLGILAKNKKQVIKAVKAIRKNYNKYEENLSEFSKNFVTNGPENTAKIICEITENKK